MKKGTCPKCGSQNIAPRQKVANESSEYVVGPLIQLREKIGKIRWRNHNYSLEAWVCGDCGYMEWFVKKPGELYSKHRQIQQARLASGETEETEGIIQGKLFLIIAAILGVLLLISIALIFVVYAIR
jgi:ribosomal protein S27AE